MKIESFFKHINITRNIYIEIYICFDRNYPIQKRDGLRLSPPMIVIGGFEMDMYNLIGPRYGARSAH